VAGVNALFVEKGVAKDGVDAAGAEAGEADGEGWRGGEGFCAGEGGAPDISLAADLCLAGFRAEALDHFPRGHEIGGVGGETAYLHDCGVVPIEIGPKEAVVRILDGFLGFVATVEAEKAVGILPRNVWRVPGDVFSHERIELR